MKDILNIDFETFSETDLTKVGSDVYSRDRSTEVLMAAVSLNDSEEEQWIPEEGQDMPRWLDEAMESPDVEKWAWNAPFEMNINRNCLGRPVDIRQWRCTMALAQMCGYPGQLEKAGPAVGLSMDKLKIADGKKLMRKFSMRKKSRKKASMGQMLRTYWYEDIESWEDYLEYNRGDVRAEKAIRKLVLPYGPPEHEWQLWELDQTINQRGLPINLDMVRNASSLYAESYAIGFRQMQELTHLSNPMSTQQLLPWLKGNGYPFDDLKKGHVKQARSYFDRKPDHWDEAQWQEFCWNFDLRDVLDQRLELSRSSIAKFDALLRATVPYDDGQHGLLRYTLQFAGAQRTARWAGRIFQPQNLPRPEKKFEKEIEMHAANVATLDRESIELIYPNTFDLLASTIRPAAQAPEGMMFIDADLNAIENRVLGWLSRCDKILRVFKENRDPYVDFATYLFHQTYEKLIAEYYAGDGSKRTIAKPGVLGCLKGETPVLTQHGWKAIVELRHDDWLHDGAKWVRHDGVVFKGYQKVLCGSGIHATPDHRFLAYEGWHEWQLVSQQQTLKSALGMGNGVFSKTEGLHAAPESYFFARADVVENESYQDQTSSEDYPLVAPDALLLTVAPTSEKGLAQNCSTFSQIVSTLRDRVVKTQITVPTNTTAGVEYVCGSTARSSGLRTLWTGSNQMDYSKLIGSTTTVITSRGIYDLQPDQNKTQTADTWDILNTGDYARFAVLTDDGCLVAHNCGYMLGPGQTYEDRSTGEIEATGLLGYAWGMGVKHFTPEESKLSVDTFRREFKEVKSYWYGIERAAMKCIKTGKPQDFDQVRFDLKGPYMRIRLPSGRHLHYKDPKIESKRAPWGDMKDTITYLGLSDKKQWVRQQTHPGKLTENVDQAISRDLLANGMMIAHHRHKLDIRLHVHDQIIALTTEEKADHDLAILRDCMEEKPRWAQDLPLGSAGFKTKVFKKD